MRDEQMVKFGQIKVHDYLEKLPMWNEDVMRKDQAENLLLGKKALKEMIPCSHPVWLHGGNCVSHQPALGRGGMVLTKRHTFPNVLHSWLEAWRNLFPVYPSHSKLPYLPYVS
jgi:hypothetical protein